MCGIFGRWDTARRRLDLTKVEAATTLLRHRGPDDEGYLLADTEQRTARSYAGTDTDPRLRLPSIRSASGDAADLAFGFRRLSIVDLTVAGHQPMASENGRYWLVFNGEIYNHDVLRRELIDLGHRFTGHSDTEVLLAALQEFGREAFRRFNGMWAVALWDTMERSLLLCRDRFGVKPLFYTFVDGIFSFASEAKALVGAHGVAFHPSDATVEGYLRRGRLPSPTTGETFFVGVHSLPPAHWLKLREGRLCSAAFYALPRAHRDDRAEGEVVAEYRALLEDSVRLRLRADVPVGTCLSGGLDSSSLVCLTRRLLGDHQARRTQKTFSAVYRDGGRYDEQPFMERVVSAAETEAHFVVPEADRLLVELPQLVWHQDEPFTTTSIFAQWCVMATARAAGVTVLLDGQGADEPLAGYRPYGRHIADLLRRGAVAAAFRESKAAIHVAGVRPRHLAAHALALQLPRALIERLQARERWYQPRWMSTRMAAHRASAAAAPDMTLDEHLRGLVHEHSLPHLLRFEDRNSMAFSIEARVPFVDFRVMEFAFKRGAHMQIRNGWTKWVLRQAMAGIVPDEIVWRRDKVGFDTPQDRWMRSLVPGLRNLFADARSEPFLNIPRVRATLAQWPNGAVGSHTAWRWLNLECWLRCWS
jgi:asparagine synthase (glutamine-hydrolysing)